MHTIEQIRSGELSGATRIKISDHLTELPQELYQYADTLEVLDLSGNALTSLPEAFKCFVHLRILFLSNNNFDVFPAVLGTLPSLDIVGFKANHIKAIPEHAFPVSLRWLILTDNKIEMLPHSIGTCIKLQKVMLAGNNLTKLPDEMALCRNIELLRISANKLDSLPAWIFSLPRLSWLAFAGNACSVRSPENKNPIPVIPWDEIEIKEQLGEGASGMIYKARVKGTDSEVAVKVFKGSVTSDGLPVDEMNACIQAGLHPNMVPVKAAIAHHPDGKEGLIMDLISSEYSNLGLPPDFSTCTRDTFSEDQAFTLNEIVRIACGIAEVAIQLHQNGIMHGDLYAHNILVNETGNPLLGDFGAATIFSVKDPELTKSLENIEVRAFGCLLEDLLLRVRKDQVFIELEEQLTAITKLCLSGNVESRPTFKTVFKKLTELFGK